MAIEKLTSDKKGAIVEEFHFDHADQSVAVTHKQDDAPIRDYIADRRLDGAQYVEGMGYEIATLPEALCVAYGTERGLPNGWYFRPEYNDEMRKLIALASDFNPHGKSM